jgi:hypothetical protein
MSKERIEDEIAGLRQELKDLESVVALPNPPLHPYTMEIALAKIAKLQLQISELEARRAQGR